jgi:hypothetical protein
MLEQIGRRLNSEPFKKMPLRITKKSSAFQTVSASASERSVCELTVDSCVGQKLAKESSFETHSQSDVQLTNSPVSCCPRKTLETSKLTRETALESSDQVQQNSHSASQFELTSPKALIVELEKVYTRLGLPVPKRDRLHNNLMKSLKTYLQDDFQSHFPEFQLASNEDKLNTFEEVLTQYTKKFFDSDIDEDFNQTLYGGKWGGFQFIFGAFVSKDTMKQMISSSREKAYFYGLQKCFKNSSQKKLAIMLKNVHLVYLIEFLFRSGKINEILM